MAGSVTLGNLAAALSDPAIGGRNALPAVLRAMGTIAVGAVRQSMTAGQDYRGQAFAPLAHARPDGGGKPLLDKGLLRASISAMVTESQITLQASHPGAAIHQFGGTIRPKGKYLAIPVTRESKRVGRARYFPRPLFFVAMKGSRQGGLLCETVTKGRKHVATLKVQYVLKESVTIPARPYLGFSDATLAKMQRVLSESYAGAILGAITGARVV